MSWGGLDDAGLHMVGGSLAFLVALMLAPVAIRKLKGAGMVGRDRNKPDRPEVAEMGGLIVVAGFMAGAFAMLMLGDLTDRQDALVLATLLLGCGAALTGVIDDFVALRQRLKAGLPLLFAIPLALFVDDPLLTVPLLGAIDLGLAYGLVLVPIAIACASNSYNMLEGFNGLGASMGLVMAVALSIVAWLGGNLTGLLITVPLAAALFAFLFYNWFPAKVFPGDTMTLFVGAMLASAGILSKVEVFTGILFLPFITEFFVKARGHFAAQSFASRVDADGTLHYEGPLESLTHLMMGRRGLTERGLVVRFVILEAILGLAVVGVALLVRP